MTREELIDKYVSAHAKWMDASDLRILLNSFARELTRQDPQGLDEAPKKDWFDKYGEEVNAVRGSSHYSEKELDEAAEKYSFKETNERLMENEISRKNERLFHWQTNKAFKAGAKWRDAQIPKLPDNLDDAAEEYMLITDTKNSHEEYMIMGAFKAGAKWMAEQGEFLNGVVRKETYGCEENGDYDEWLTVHIDSILEQLPKNTQFKPGDKVIVQIRKK